MSAETLGRIRLDSGLEYQAAPEVIVAVEKLRNDNEEAKTRIDALNSEVEKLAGERDTLKARVDGFDAELQKARTDALEEVKQLEAVKKVAETFKVDAADKTARQIKEAVIGAVRKDAGDLSGKSDEYINAAFDMAVSLRSDAAMADQRVKTAARMDGAKPTSGEAYQNFMKQLGNKEAA